MSLMKLAHILVSVGLLLLMAIGCAPPPTPTPLPPTPVLAASAQDIAGTWQGIGTDGLYMRFNADGTLHVAKSLEALNTKPDAINTFRFEGTRLIFTEVEASGLPSCGAAPAIYEVQLQTNGNIKFVKIQDTCSKRATSTSRVHKPVP